MTEDTSTGNDGKSSSKRSFTKTAKNGKTIPDMEWRLGCSRCLCPTCALIDDCPAHEDQDPTVIWGKHGPHERDESIKHIHTAGTGRHNKTGGWSESIIGANRCNTVCGSTIGTKKPLEAPLRFNSARTRREEEHLDEIGPTICPHYQRDPPLRDLERSQQSPIAACQNQMSPIPPSKNEGKGWVRRYFMYTSRHGQKGNIPQSQRG